LPQRTPKTRKVPSYAHHKAGNTTAAMGGKLKYGGESGGKKNGKGNAPTSWKRGDKGRSSGVASIKKKTMHLKKERSGKGEREWEIPQVAFDKGQIRSKGGINTEILLYVTKKGDIKRG